MQDHVKSCIREKNSGNMIFHVSNDKLGFERKPEMIVKSISDIAKNIKTYTRTVTICKIV